jgi:hypothetical protein
MGFQRYFNRENKDRDLAEEIQSHLAHEVDANLARGLSDAEARRQARLKFGNPLAVRETCLELSVFADGGKYLARSTLRLALSKEDSGIYNRRSSCDRAWDRSEHGGLLGCEYRTAPVATVSRSAVSHETRSIYPSANARLCKRS